MSETSSWECKERSGWCIRALVPISPTFTEADPRALARSASASHGRSTSLITHPDANRPAMTAGTVRRGSRPTARATAHCERTGRRSRGSAGPVAARCRSSLDAFHRLARPITGGPVGLRGRLGVAVDDTPGEQDGDQDGGGLPDEVNDRLTDRARGQEWSDEAGGGTGAADCCGADGAVGSSGREP